MDGSAIGRHAHLLGRLAQAVVLAGVIVAAAAGATPAALARTHPRSSHGSSPPCAGAHLIPTSENIPQIATATLCLINRQRALHHERPLSDNADLDSAASAHAEDMIAKGYFAHVSPTGESPTDWVKASGYVPRRYTYELGENIALCPLGAATPAATVATWMSSPAHRANILTAGYRDSGIGVVAAMPAPYGTGVAGATYTQDFAVRASPRWAIS